MNKKNLFLYLLIIGIGIYFPFSSKAQQSVSAKLESSFKSFLTQPNLEHGIAGIQVVDSKTGQLVFEKNSQVGLPTASTMKVITSATALDILGSDYTYKTTLYYTGEIDSLGVLQGDIVIQGSGDPTLGSDRYPEQAEHTLLHQWVNAVKLAGIDQINGKIIGDDRLYGGNDIPTGWVWTDIGNYYGAGISGLNWRENKAGVNFETGAVGKPAVFTLKNDISYLSVINTVTIGSKGSGDNVNGFSAPYSTKIYLKGTYGQDLKKTIEISVPDPGFDAAFQLHAAIMQQGIAISQAPTTGQRLEEQDSIFPTKQADLFVHQSPKLKDIIYAFNQKSINLYGEALLKSIGYFSGNKTSTEDGAAYMQKYWNQKLKIQANELDIKDGSGLSPQNHVTAAAMTKIMHYAKSRPWHADFIKSLPIFNHMTMKSGTIGSTLGYTGYHKSTLGKEFTFTMLVYNYSGSASKMRQSMFTVLDNLK